MSQMFSELDVISITVGSETRERHLSAIRKTIGQIKPVRRRFRLMAVAVAAVFLIPVLALAAEQSQPGDFLYPLRQVIPWTSELDEPGQQPTPDSVPGVEEFGTDDRSVSPPSSVGTDRSDVIERDATPDRVEEDPIVDRPVEDEPSEPSGRGKDDEAPTRDQPDSTVAPHADGATKGRRQP